jgi:hypothetical protein
MLFEKYSSLIARFPDGCEHLFGQGVVGRSDLWFSIDASDHPSLLFETTEGDEQPDLKLKYVEVEFARRCDISMEGGGRRVGTFTAVSFKDDDADLVRIFLRLLEEAFLSEEGPHSSQEIRSKIIALADIFSRLETNVKDVIGLWGELFVIRRSRDPVKVARAWCLAKSAQFDFLGENHVLEVKATTKARRLHRFSLEQVRPSSGLNPYICSILLVELPSGITVGELMDEVLELIEDANDRSRVFHQCLKKGGKDIYSSTLPLAVFPDGTSLAVFSASTIPVPQVDDSVPIYNVRFDADLTEVQALSASKMHGVLSLQ